MWECGLKYRATKTYDDSVIVTPLVGVWIEINDYHWNNYGAVYVTPLVGVWIEIHY